MEKAAAAAAGGAQKPARQDKVDHNSRTPFTPSPFRMNSVYDPTLSQLTGTGSNAPSPMNSLDTLPAMPSSTATLPAAATARGGPQGGISATLPNMVTTMSLSMTYAQQAKVPGWTFPLTSQKLISSFSFHHS